MKVYMYDCDDHDNCDYKGSIEGGIIYYELPGLCPKCGSSIHLYTDIEQHKCYRVLISKKASNIEDGDLYYFRHSDEYSVVLGIREITKKGKLVLSIALKGFGTKTHDPDEIVYTINGTWNPELDRIRINNEY